MDGCEGELVRHRIRMVLAEVDIPFESRSGLEATGKYFAERQVRDL